MRAEHAPANAELYKNLAFGVQGTGGSTAIANSYEQMRQVGRGGARHAGRRGGGEWGVPADEITVEKACSVTRPARQGRSASSPTAPGLPVPDDAQLKDPATSG